MTIGVVTGTSSSSPYNFFVRLHQENNRPIHMVQIDDVVKVIFSYKPYGEIIYYGIVTEINARWDFGLVSGYEEEIALKGLLPAFPIYIATVTTTRMLRVEKGKVTSDAPQVPPPPGTEVLIAEGEEIDIALGFDDLIKQNMAVPIGTFRNGRPAYVDVRYILGENGAHINISGQSGVASKTSYATFLVRSFLDTGKKLREKNELMGYLSRSRFIIFNVKGEGLLFLDKWSKDWKNLEKEEQGKHWKKMYESMGIEPKPFEKVLFYAPRRSKKNMAPWSNKRYDNIFSYGWDCIDIFKMGLFELMFDPQELEINQNLQLAVTTVQEFLYERLEKAVEEAAKFCHKNSCFPSTTDDEIILRTAIANGFDIVAQGKLPEGIDDLIKMFSEDSDKEFSDKMMQELKGKSTIMAMIRRLKSIKNIGMDLIWIPTSFLSAKVGTTEEHKINWDHPGQVTVIDISKLRPRVQSFVVGAVLVEVMRSREEKTDQDPVFIFLDELNKYAPRHGGGPLGNLFRDIAERGRSFRVIMIGAEQTASEVDYRIITQSSTTVVGRQKGAELEKPEYAHLTVEQKERAALLQQGEMIVDQPFMRIPITVSFPLPAWCTREDGYYTLSEEKIKQIEGKLYG
ncbi:ATP-binding protein [Thermotoga profunda]|uniref:ATP-binding protein n=1 Tax=Thermotoga profunda TaxID=1508420 RepID=UPI000597D0E0|nr:ATP-binding protein [Thermotoga profunda]